MTNVKAYGCASLMALGIGCADVAQEAPNTPEVAQKSQEIIGGAPANSASLNAIGATVLHFPVLDEVTGETTVQYFAECTASLISSQTLLLAKHCVDSFEIIANPGDLIVPEGTGLFFHMGPDLLNPVRMIEIVGVEKAPTDEGGVLDLGSDVATFHLGEKITEVTPLTLGVLEPRLVGKDFASIGYGVQDNLGTSGTRLAGTETLRGTSGRLYELMFGSYEAFKEFALTGDAPPKASAAKPGQLRLLLGATGRADDDAGSEEADAGSEQPDAGSEQPDAGDDLDVELRDQYENTYLLEGYEAYTGNLKGNTQTCNGDSGGPLVRPVGGKLRAYGVVSGGLGSNQLSCDLGTVYATFGEDTLSFLNESKKWVDPCKGVSTLGVCERNTVKRCTTLTEGPRRLTKTNCGLLAQTCGIDEAGAAACVDR